MKRFLLIFVTLGCSCVSTRGPNIKPSAGHDSQVQNHAQTGAVNTGDVAGGKIAGDVEVGGGPRASIGPIDATNVINVIAQAADRDSWTVRGIAGMLVATVFGAPAAAWALWRRCRRYLVLLRLLIEAVESSEGDAKQKIAMATAKMTDLHKLVKKVTQKDRTSP